MSSYSLTKSQKECVELPQGPNLVVAGAGTGKTTVIAQRFINLITVKKIKPERILLVTFTNKAVKNLKEKIVELIPLEFVNSVTPQNIRVQTFHALSKEILTWVYERNNTSVKKICRDSSCLNIVREILESTGTQIRAKGIVFEIIKRIRWKCKSERKGFTYEDYLSIGLKVTEITNQEKFEQKFPYEDIETIYHYFTKALDERHLMTIDDMLLDAACFLDDPFILDEWSNKFDEILCDEFQDVDEVQFDILKKISHKNSHLFCVGDPDQSIYGFRGSLPKIFNKMKVHFDSLGKTTIRKKLEDNFRSTPEILKVANHLINSNPIDPSELDTRKELKTNNPSGVVPTFHITNNHKELGLLVLKHIQELHKTGVPYSDMIVLGRNRSHYKYVKNTLFSAAVHYDDWKEIFTLLNYKEIRDLIHWINVGFLKDPFKDFFKVFNRPRMGVGEITIRNILFSSSQENFFQALEERATTNLKLKKLYAKYYTVRKIAEDETLTLSAKCRRIAEESGILDYYRETSDQAHAMDSFLDCAIISEAKSWENEVYTKISGHLKDERVQKVIFSTIHGVKGLEFEHVFLLSLAEGELPSKRGFLKITSESEKQDYIEEEKRILYVALTRAKKTLNIYAGKGVDKLSQFAEAVRKNTKSGFIADYEKTDKDDDDGEGMTEQEIANQLDDY